MRLWSNCVLYIVWDLNVLKFSHPQLQIERKHLFRSFAWPLSLSAVGSRWKMCSRLRDLHVKPMWQEPQCNSWGSRAIEKHGHRGKGGNSSWMECYRLGFERLPLTYNPAMLNSCWHRCVLEGLPSSSHTDQRRWHNANPISGLLWGADLFDSVKSPFVKTGAHRWIWADVWRTRWQHQVTVTASVPLWISAGRDMCSEQLETTLPIMLNFPTQAKLGGGGSLWQHIMSNENQADIC